MRWGINYQVIISPRPVSAVSESSQTGSQYERTGGNLVASKSSLAAFRIRQRQQFHSQHRKYFPLNTKYFSTLIRKYLTLNTKYFCKYLFQFDQKIFRSKPRINMMYWELGGCWSVPVCTGVMGPHRYNLCLDWWTDYQDCCPLAGLPATPHQ